MKHLFALLLTAYSFACLAQTERLNINGYEFVFKKTSGELNQLKSLKLFRIEPNREEKYLLEHILYEGLGDCNSLSVEMGNYVVEGNQIVFNTFWCRFGDAPVSPWGARSQTYQVQADGKLALSASELYIETTRRDWEEGNEGMEYLFTPAETAEEKTAFTSYVKSAERDYFANFVFGKKAEALLQKVKSQFSSKIEELISNWEELGNPFGYKV